MSTRHDGDEREARLRAIPGGLAPGEVPSDEPANEDEIRAAKVAEARLKILNGYYGRKDVQKQLAERLIFALGS